MSLLTRNIYFNIAQEGPEPGEERCSSVEFELCVVVSGCRPTGEQYGEK